MKTHNEKNRTVKEINHWTAVYNNVLKRLPIAAKVQVLVFRQVVYLYIIIGRDLTRQSDRPYLVQSGYGGELQAKLIEVCGLPTVQL